jgi:predicted nuclease of predicted toxin-antitoxin system
VKFLVDANLPPALVEWLTSEGYEAQHVAGLGLENASDRAIWPYAQASSACIVTKDEDFVLLQSLDSRTRRCVDQDRQCCSQRAAAPLACRMARRCRRSHAW